VQLDWIIALCSATVFFASIDYLDISQGQWAMICSVVSLVTLGLFSYLKGDGKAGPRTPKGPGDESKIASHPETYQRLLREVALAASTDDPELSESTGAAADTPAALSALSALPAEYAEHLPTEIINANMMVTNLGFTVHVAVSLVTKFSVHLERAVAEMQEAEANERWDVQRQERDRCIYRCAHSIKGAALQVNAMRLSVVSAWLEAHAKKGDSELARMFLAAWYEVANELKEVLRSRESAALFQAPVRSPKLTPGISPAAGAATNAVMAAVQTAKKDLHDSYQAQLRNLDSILLAAGKASNSSVESSQAAWSALSRKL